MVKEERSIGALPCFLFSSRSSHSRVSGKRVGDDVRGWRAGELMLFDDSFEHEVWYWPRRPTTTTSAGTASSSSSSSSSAAAAAASSSVSSPSSIAEATAFAASLCSAPVGAGAGSGGGGAEDERVVLLFDFWHPLLTPVERDVISQFMPQLYTRQHQTPQHAQELHATLPVDK